MPFLSPIWKRLISDAEFGARSRLKRSKSATKPRKLAVKRRSRKLKDPSTSSTKNTTLRRNGTSRRTSTFHVHVIFIFLSYSSPDSEFRSKNTRPRVRTHCRLVRHGRAFVITWICKTPKARHLRELDLVRLTCRDSRRFYLG